MIFNCKMYINARIPRVINEQKQVSSIESCWTDSRVSYTYLFEVKVIDALKLSGNQTRTYDFFNTTFEIVHAIIKRTVAKGLTRRRLNGISVINLDEKSVKNGQSYITILSDTVGKCVIDIIEGPGQPH